MADRDIPEEMVETCTQALRDAGFVDPDDDTVPKFFPAASGMAEQGARIDVWVPARDAAVAVLSAALAGRTVLELPEPEWVRDDVPGMLPSALFDACSYVVTAVATSNGPRVNVRGGPIMRPEEAEQRGAALIAAAREARRLASGSGVGDQP